MDAFFRLIAELVTIFTFVGILYAATKWAAPRVRRHRAARRLKRLLPEMRMNEMAERITALENQLAWQEDYMKSIVRDMFALDRLNTKQVSGLLDLHRGLLETRRDDIESDRESNRLLFAVLTDFCDQIDHLWDSHEAALTLIDSTLTQLKALQATTATPELKSA